MTAITSRDRQILRELARRKHDIGVLPVQQEKAQLWRDLNGLRSRRPMVWINEIPWHELATVAPELRPQCEDPFLKSVEIELRRELYQWDHFACDMVVEPVLYSGIVGGPTSVYADYGIQEQAQRVEGTHDVVYEPVIHSMADVEKIRTPHVWYDQAQTQHRLEMLQDLLDGVIPVQRRGLVTQWHTPWDQAVHWYGVHQLMLDLYDNPELVGAVVKRVCEATAEVLDKQQELGMLDVGSGNWRVGSGGMGFTDELPTQVTDRPATPADQWGCGNAQVFSEVSPAMHEEFSLQYERPVMERFGLTYYGCCEPLHSKIEMLRSISNLRKISMSPKADMRQAAEQVGGDYVLSFKPTPVHMAVDTFREEPVRQYLRDALDAAAGCHVEIILKDITTARADPMRMTAWARVAMEVVEQRDPVGAA